MANWGFIFEMFDYEQHDLHVWDHRFHNEVQKILAELANRRRTWELYREVANVSRRIY